MSETHLHLLSNTHLASGQDTVFRPHVLFIDDDSAISFLAKQSLDKSGFQTVLASSADEAIQRLSEYDISIILLDITMPNIDGVEFCQMLKMSSQATDIPVIIISGRFDEDTVQKSFDAGAIDFVRKPVNWTILKNRVSNTIKQINTFKRLKVHESVIDNYLRMIND